MERVFLPHALHEARNVFLLAAGEDGRVVGAESHPGVQRTLRPDGLDRLDTALRASRTARDGALWFLAHWALDIALCLVSLGLYLGDEEYESLKMIWRLDCEPVHCFWRKEGLRHVA